MRRAPDSREAARFVAAAALSHRAFQAAHLLFANQSAENSGWVDDQLLARIGVAAGVRASGSAAAVGAAAARTPADGRAFAARYAIDSTATLMLARRGGELRRFEPPAPMPLRLEQRLAALAR